VTITLEAPDTVHAGDAINGTVKGAARVRVFVRRTVISRGRSGVEDLPQHQAHAASVVVEEGPFTLPALRGPLTYRGERVELRWSVVAEAEGSDDRAEAPFTLVTPRATTYEREAAGGYRDLPTETATLEPDFGDQFVEGARHTDAYARNDAFAMLGAWVRRTFDSFSANRGGATNVTLEVTPSRAHAGDDLDAKLAFTTNEEIVVESITIQIAGREHATYMRDEEQLLESHIETISERARLTAGPHEYATRLHVPANAPASFATGGVAIAWFVRATIQIDGQLDAVKEIVIRVAPF
jgi:hypothetical protein